LRLISDAAHKQSAKKVGHIPLWARPVPECLSKRSKENCVAKIATICLQKIRRRKSKKPNSEFLKRKGFRKKVIKYQKCSGEFT
jgi:hypothetical protein